MGFSPCSYLEHILFIRSVAEGSAVSLSRQTICTGNSAPTLVIPTGEVMGLRPTQGNEKRLGPASALYGTVTLSLSSRPERTRISYLAPLTMARMRLSVEKGGRSSPAPPSFTGNPGERSGGTCGFPTGGNKPKLPIKFSTGNKGEGNNNYFRGSTISKFFWCINDTTTLAVCNPSHCSLVIGKLKIANP